jgi:hypothetical protein
MVRRQTAFPVKWPNVADLLIIAAKDGPSMSESRPGETVSTRHKMRSTTLRSNINPEGRALVLAYSFRIKTRNRKGIVIHPGMDFVSSIGCLNPSGELKNKASNIDFDDSRARVVAMIDFHQREARRQLPEGMEATSSSTQSSSSRASPIERTLATRGAIRVVPTVYCHISQDDHGFWMVSLEHKESAERLPSPVH